MHRRIKAIAFILTIACTMALFFPESSAGTVTLQERSIEDIMNKYREKPFSLNGSGQVEYDITPSPRSPYAAGKVKDKHLQEAINALNFVRYITGLPDDILLDETYTSYAQHGAVLLAALGKLTHNPPKPSDMPQKFYETAYKGPSNSNCAYGYDTITGTILGFMDDSDPSNIDRLGHRRWLLNPPMKKTGFGYCDGFSDTYVFDRSRGYEIRYDFISWPARNYMPVEFMNRQTAWSVNLGNEYDNPSVNDVQVTLKRRNDGKTWTFSGKSNSGSTGNYFNVDNNGYGMPKCIIFRPAIDGYNANDVFDVTITGISKGGVPAEIKYTVQMFSLLKQQPAKEDRQEGTYNRKEVSQWAESDIEKAIGLKLIPQQMQGNYRQNISRADFCKLVVNFLVQKTGKTVSELLIENNATIKYNTFTDTSDNDILAAYALGIVKGVGKGRFNPDGMISRQEAAVMLMRTAKVLGVYKTNGSPETFTDIGEVADWAKESVAFVSSLADKTCNMKIMGGVGNGRFSPNGTFTREQSYVTMLRLYNAI